MIRQSEIIAAVARDLAEPDSEAWMRSHGFDPEAAVNYSEKATGVLLRAVAAALSVDKGETAMYHLIAGALMGQLLVGYRLGLGARDLEDETTTIVI